jgi:hypothetical protein
MTRDIFDFCFVDRAWTWTHRVDGAAVADSTRTFPTLSGCVADAATAGFQAGVEHPCERTTAAPSTTDTDTHSLRAPAS